MKKSVGVAKRKKRENGHGRDEESKAASDSSGWFWFPLEGEHPDTRAPFPKTLKRVTTRLSDDQQRCIGGTEHSSTRRGFPLRGASEATNEA